jgi:hypothetical protein
MTRFLSHALEATEPNFGLGLRNLEASHGNQGHDIRLAVAIKQQARSKLLALQLDPKDTKAGELYHALLERLKADERELTRQLQTQAATHVSAEAKVLDGMLLALNDLPETKQSFSLKPARFKALVKAVPPKKAMKALGYRSLPSFIKHESAVSILFAASLLEDVRWQQALLNQYKKLTPTDFEMRPILFLGVTNPKLLAPAEQWLQRHRQPIIGLKELGAVLILPLPKELPAGTVVATLGHTLQTMLDMRSDSMYLKFSQVHKDFGALVQKMIVGKPNHYTGLNNEGTSWQLIQHFLGKTGQSYQPEHISPHLESADFVHLSIEKILSNIHPAFQFWENCSQLVFQSAKKPISFNILDVALNSCNNFPLGKHVCRACRRLDTVSAAVMVDDPATMVLMDLVVRSAGVTTLVPATVAFTSLVTFSPGVTVDVPATVAAAARRTVSEALMVEVPTARASKNSPPEFGTTKVGGRWTRLRVRYGSPGITIALCVVPDEKPCAVPGRLMTLIPPTPTSRYRQALLRPSHSRSGRLHSPV